MSKEAIDANPAVFAGVKTAGDLQDWAAQKMGESRMAPGARAAVASRADQYEQQLAEAKRRGEADPKYPQDKVVSALTLQFNQAHAIEVQRDRDAKDEAWKIVSQTGDYTKVPDTLWARVDGLTQKSLMDYSEKRARGAVKNDWGVFYALEREAVQDPDRFGKRDLTQHFAQLDDSHRDKIISLQREVASKGVNSERLSAIRPRSELVRDTFRDVLGIPEKDDSDEAKMKRAAFERKVDDAITVIESTKKRKAEPQEIRTVVDNLAKEVVFKRPEWYLPNVKGRVYDFSISDIPNAERAKIESSLKSQGLPANDANIVAAFTRVYAQKSN
jgi:hypothetical protein